LIATTPLTDVKEDGKPTPSTTSRPTDKSSNQPIHTLLFKDLANTLNPRESSMFNPMSTSKLTPFLNSRPPSPRDQPPSPLKPTPLSSKDTPVEFSTPLLAEPNSITPSPLSDTESPEDKNTTLSETHGVLHGEWLDTLTSQPLLETESAVSKCNPSGQPPTDLLFYPIIKIT